jgi:DNA replication and repair protein RecF
MVIQGFRLRNFRNFERLEISDISSGINILHGPNGSGKTNILEAISLGSLAKSCRGAQDFEMVRHGESAAVVEIDGVAQKKKLI